MFVEITNEPRDYAWGSTTAIAELLGTQPTGAPQAELWLGAHPGSPARVVGALGEERTLLDLVEGRLPFLLKVLAAEAPLSLQAHPTPLQAEEGFARENAAGVPLDAPTRARLRAVGAVPGALRVPTGRRAARGARAGCRRPAHPPPRRSARRRHLDRGGVRMAHREGRGGRGCRECGRRGLRHGRRAEL